METISFNSPINISEKRKWLLAVTSFEATNSVFNITGETNSFLISTSGLWSSSGGADSFTKLKIFLELRHKNDIELHVKEVKKR